MYDNNIDSPGVARQQGRRSIMHMTVKGGGFMFLVSSTEESQQANDMMQLYTNNINQIRNSYL
jgi:hypothetical protein